MQFKQSSDCLGECNIAYKEHSKITFKTQESLMMVFKKAESLVAKRLKVLALAQVTVNTPVDSLARPDIELSGHHYIN